MRLNWGKTFVLGFGFLAISAVATLYDSYMPKFYAEFVQSSLWIGMIMGVDNALGMSLQPYFGALSDRTQTRFGRRRPFLLIGMPIAAAMIVFVPFAFQIGLTPLIATTTLLNLAMAFFRSPTVALMPDFTPPPLRSTANGVINLMGGVGAAIAMLAGGMLYRLNPSYPFMMSGSIMIAVFLIFLTVIREPKGPEFEPDADEKPQGVLTALGGVLRSPDRSALILLSSIFLLFVAAQSVQTWFTLYAEAHLGLPVNEGSMRLAFFAAAVIAGAIPAGMIATSFGRKRTVVAGLAGLVLCFLAMNFLASIPVVSALLVISGLFWALVSINIYPMVVQMCHPSQTGAYTGLYYIFSGLAGTLGPGITGKFFDIAGSRQSLFLIGAGFMAVALVAMSSVRKGEAVTSAGHAPPLVSPT